MIDIFFIFLKIIAIIVGVSTCYDIWKYRHIDHTLFTVFFIFFMGLAVVFVAITGLSDIIKTGFIPK